VYDFGNVNAAWRCEGFEPRCDVDAIAENIVVLDDKFV
jgi:hypothetical protein